MKKTVHSFDVFDTLVGRIHASPRSVFNLVEKNFPYPGFAALRIAAEAHSKGTLDDIYRELVRSGHITQEEAQKLRDFEWKMECEHLFPIPCNLKRIKDGDLLVTDTYYTKAEILKIMRLMGLRKRVHIFATYSGKALGTIWPKILKRYKVISHKGDSFIPDVTTPKQYGIRPIHFKEGRYSPIEDMLFNKTHVELANLVRAVRLSNPYPPRSVSGHIWHEESQFNVPILILASLYFGNWCHENNKNRLLFTSRGCCHLIDIFKTLFPEFSSIYFLSSRAAYQNPSQYYIEYVKSVYNDTSVIIDEQGTGDTCHQFFAKYFSTTPSYLALVSAKQRPGISHIQSCAIEYLNYAREGSLVNFDAKGPIFMPLEYDVKFVLPAYACIQKCTELLSYYRIESFDQRVIEHLLHVLKETPLYSSKCITHLAKHDCRY